MHEALFALLAAARPCQLQQLLPPLPLAQIPKLLLRLVAVLGLWLWVLQLCVLLQRRQLVAVLRLWLRLLQL